MESTMMIDVDSSSSSPTVVTHERDPFRSCNEGQLYFGRRYDSEHLEDDVPGEPVVVKELCDLEKNVAARVLAKTEVKIHYEILSQPPSDLSPYVARMYEYTYDEETDSVRMVIERGEGGDLFSFVIKSVPQHREFYARKLFGQMMEGLKFIHGRRVAHLDIKLENLVLTLDNNLKIIDFGLSRHYPVETEEEKDGTSPARESHLLGTTQWMAPEIFDAKTRKQGFDPFRADIWSCGVVLFTMLFCVHPFEAPCNDDWRFNMIVGGNLRGCLRHQSRSGEASPEAIDLLQKMLRPADQRPSISDILESDFLREEPRRPTRRH